VVEVPRVVVVVVVGPWGAAVVVEPTEAVLDVVVVEIGRVVVVVVDVVEVSAPGREVVVVVAGCVVGVVGVVTTGMKVPVTGDVVVGLFGG